jgi:hypothetical protein
MQYTVKAKICTVVGIGLIVFVASLVGLPFADSESNEKKISYENTKKLHDSEQKMFDVIAQEKAEIESKIGGKINFP